MNKVINMLIKDGRLIPHEKCGVQNAYFTGICKVISGCNFTNYFYFFPDLGEVEFRYSQDGIRNGEYVGKGYIDKNGILKDNRNRFSAIPIKQ